MFLVKKMEILSTIKYVGNQNYLQLSSNFDYLRINTYTVLI